VNRVGGIDELRALVRAGYSPLPDAVGARKDLTSTAKMLFAQLVRYAIAYDTVEVFPSQEALCQRLGVSIKTLYNATKELADEALGVGVAQVEPVAGPVEVVAVPALGARVPAQARLLLEEQPGPAEVHRRGDPRETSAEDDHLGTHPAGSRHSGPT